jgi:hypothetical protein
MEINIMDYRIIYDKFIEYFKNVSVVDRVYRRNPFDERIGNNIYTEVHHITPRHCGGSNDSDNLVVLLPEEHLFIHYLRYKVFGEYCDIYAVNFMINGFNSREKFSTNIRLNKLILSKYSKVRSEFGKIISMKNKGNKAISEARKNTMPVKDAITGEMIGSVSTNHPKVVLGEWVHHSKGKKVSEDQLSIMRVNNTGLRNPNSSGYTDDEILEFAFDMIDVLGYYSNCAWKKISKSNNIPLHFTKFRFNGKGYAGFKERLLEYNPNSYDKTLMWCHSDKHKENRLYVPSVNLPSGWVKGENKEYDRNYRI